jgi:hypothetical protein
VGQAEALVAETRNYAWNQALEAAGGDEDAASQATAISRSGMWRPATYVGPRSKSSRAHGSPRLCADGVVVGQHFDYGEETGEQSFDVLIGGVVSGQFVWWPSDSALPAIIADNVLSIDEAGRARRRVSREQRARSRHLPIAYRQPSDPGGRTWRSPTSVRAWRSKARRTTGDRVPGCPAAPRAPGERQLTARPQRC